MLHSYGRKTRSKGKLSTSIYYNDILYLYIYLVCRFPGAHKNVLEQVDLRLTSAGNSWKLSLRPAKPAAPTVRSWSKASTKSNCSTQSGKWWARSWLNTDLSSLGWDQAGISFDHQRAEPTEKWRGVMPPWCYDCGFKKVNYIWHRTKQLGSGLLCSTIINIRKHLHSFGDVWRF